MARSQQRAGLLNQIFGGLGPGLSVRRPEARSAICSVDSVPDAGDAGSGSSVSPSKFKTTPTANPSIIEKVSDFYAQHPTLVRTLGSVALSIALSNMARRN